MQGTFAGSLHLFFHIWFKMYQSLASHWLVRNASCSPVKA